MSAQVEIFERERARLVRMAARILSDHAEAEDIVQRAWLRLSGTDEHIENLGAWLTTVTGRLCLDRLRARIPEPSDEAGDDVEAHADPAMEVALADAVGVALQVVLDRLAPRERVAFVLHESFGVDFPTILDASPAAARKLASRARIALAQTPSTAEDSPAAAAEVVDAFLVAAREGEFERLLALLAPGAVVTGDDAAVALGTPREIVGRRHVAEFFDGAAKTAFGVFIEGRPGAAWFHRGRARVAFDFTIAGGAVTRIEFRAAPEILASVHRRTANRPVQSSGS